MAAGRQERSVKLGCATKGLKFSPGSRSTMTTRDGSEFFCKSSRPKVLTARSSITTESGTCAATLADPSTPASVLSTSAPMSSGQATHPAEPPPPLPWGWPATAIGWIGAGRLGPWPSASKGCLDAGRSSPCPSLVATDNSRMSALRAMSPEYTGSPFPLTRFCVWDTASPGRPIGDEMGSFAVDAKISAPSSLHSKLWAAGVAMSSTASVSFQSISG